MTKRKQRNCWDDLGYTQKNEEGIRLDETGEPLSFEIITYAGNDIRSRACEMMKTELAEVGIDLQIQSLDMDTADALYLAGL